MIERISYKSPVGNLVISAEDDAVIALDWSDEKFDSKAEVLKEAVKQLEEYFAGKRKDFDLPLEADGTEFSCKVWEQMLEIPFGKFISYQDIADKLKSHPRAVGMACGKNPIPIIIPCHRVLAKSGKLNGYSGGDGIETKRKLLVLEGNKNV